MPIDPIYEEAAKRAHARSLDPKVLLQEGIDGFKAGLASGLGASDATCSRIDYDAVETTEGFAVICGLLLALEAKKGKKYAGSWIKRGEEGGAWPNVQRKFDRLEQNLFSTPNPSIVGPEGRMECLADLAVYSIKWLTYLMETRPGEFVEYVDRIAIME